MSKHTLSRAAAMMCANPDFQKWMSFDSETETAEGLRDYCGISSRRELDANPAAAERFHKLRKLFINRKEEQCKN